MCKRLQQTLLQEDNMERHSSFHTKGMPTKSSDTSERLSEWLKITPNRSWLECRTTGTLILY